MPYYYKKVDDKYCVYKKSNDEKVGCTDGDKTSLNKYLTALAIAHKRKRKKKIKEQLKETFRKLILKETILTELTDHKKDNVSIETELTNNKGLDFTPNEIDIVKNVLKSKDHTLHLNDENPITRGHELSFQKEMSTNNFYFIVKKLANKSDSSGKSIKYGVWYISYTNEEDLKNPTTVYYKLSNAVNLQNENGKINQIELDNALTELISTTLNKYNL